MIEGISEHFFEWDYDNGVVIEYERLGECNGCGDCCKAVIQFAVAGSLSGPPDDWATAGNGGPATGGTGVWGEVRVGDNRRFFKIIPADRNSDHRCQHLTEDNRCAIQQTKPLFHKAWPMSPRQIVQFERCSYSFRVVAYWPLEVPEPSESDSDEQSEVAGQAEAWLS